MSIHSRIDHDCSAVFMALFGDVGRKRRKLNRTCENESMKIMRNEIKQGKMNENRPKT